MNPRSFIKDIVIGVIEDERTQVVAETLAAKVITKYVAPLIAPAIGAAVDRAFDRMTDLNNDGKPDIKQGVEAAENLLGQLIPSWIKIPGINAPL